MSETPDVLLQDCPFPQVAESLRPYIKTRQEVHAIRRSRHSTLPISSAAITATHHDLDDAHLGSLSGVRKAYVKALRANQEAQARYDSLKAEIDQLATSPGSAAPNIGTDATLLTQSYISLARQRERKRKLAVIEKTMTKISTAGGNVSTESFDKVARREAGELPIPPSTTGFTDREFGSDADYDLTKLKKAVLSAKHDLAEHKRSEAEANGFSHGEVNAYADLRALQKTHQELTIWMEQQLAMISDIDRSREQEGSIGKDDAADGLDTGAINEIGNIYEEYLEARERLLDTVAHPQTNAMSAPSSPDVIRRGSPAAEAEQPNNISERMLPYLPRLLALRRREQNLLQQVSSMRHQVASAETHTQAVLGRLSDESHLVQPEVRSEPPRGQDWTKAANQASPATNAAASKRLERGRDATESASNTLDSIRDVPRSLDLLLESLD